MTQEELNTLFDDLTVAHRTREDLMKPRIIVSNQLKAIKRNAIKRHVEINIEDMEQNQVSKEEKKWEKTMVGISKLLPLYDWWCQHEGCSSLGLAMLLAETGNPSNYENPAKLWKRMGLDVWEGEANKNKFKGINTGYSKRRRMIAYRISSAIIKKKGKYRDVYDVRKKYEIERDEKGYNKDYVEKKKTFMMATYKTSVKKIKEGKLPACVIDARAQRYMVKKLIKDLWIAWQKEMNTNFVATPWKKVGNF